MYKYLFFLSILHCFNLFSTSFVYNFRVAEITKHPGLSPSLSIKNKEKPKSKNKNILGLIFNEYLKTYNKFNYNYSGLFESFIYNSRSYFFRSDFAFANIIEKNKHKQIYQGVEPDDILLTAGYSFTINKVSMLALSGLFGIPTKKSLILKHVDFGYGQVALGLQLDGFYGLNLANGLVYGFSDSR